MTLIVGFKSRDSAVLCADSQETHSGGFKTEINKLPIREAESGGMDIVCGGAGNSVLADACRRLLLREMAVSVASGEEAIRRELENLLVGFHSGPVFTSFPGSADDKYIAGLIAVRSATKQVFLYKFFSSSVEAVTTYALAGEDYAFLDRIVSRRYKPNLSIHQSVLLGLEVVSEAKETSSTVGGATRVVIATPTDGIQTQDSDRVKWTEAHIATQNQIIDALRLDLSSTDDQMTAKLNTFSNSITSVRNVYGSKYPAWPSATIGNLKPDDESSE